MVTAQTCKLKYLHTGPGGPFGGGRWGEPGDGEMAQGLGSREQ